MTNQKSRVISFRCPEDVFREVEVLCEHSRADRSDFIVKALQSLINHLADPEAGTPGTSCSSSILKGNNC